MASKHGCARYLLTERAVLTVCCRTYTLQDVILISLAWTCRIPEESEKSYESARAGFEDLGPRFVVMLMRFELARGRPPVKPNF
jgi:hypothetical protein